MSYEYNCGMWHWIEMQAPQTIIMPLYLLAGDCWEFQLMIGNYDGFAGGLMFVGPGSGNKVSSIATIEEGVFNWEIPAAATKVLTPQTYLWTCTMTDPVDGCRYTIQSGSIQVVGDLATAAPPTQTQTALQQLLYQVDQTLLTILGDQFVEVEFSGQKYTQQNAKDLWYIRNSIANRVAAEQAALSGNSRSDRILPRFVFR
jgi:hypothetical protein